MKSAAKASAAVGAIALLGMAGSAGAATEARHAQACTPTQNIEAIVDDSLSMADTDPQRLRVQALGLFIDTPSNQKKTLGAVEFYGEAEPLFGPSLIAQNRASMHSILESRITNGDSATDYNAAFSVAAAHNPNAQARIFLTDGGHLAQEGPYAEGHRGGPPTHVIALASEQYLRPGSEDEARLQRIAAETGGIYRRADEATDIQEIVADLNSRVSCESAPRKIVDTFTRLGQTKKRTLTLPRSARSALFTLSWASKLDQFDIGGFRIVRRGKVVAKSAKVRRLRVTRRSGETYMTVKVSGLVRGKLRYTLRARRLGLSVRGGQLTTQIVRSRRR